MAVNLKKGLWYLEFDNDNEMDDCVLFDVVVNGDSDNDDNII